LYSYFRKIVGSWKGSLVGGFAILRVDDQQIGKSIGDLIKDYSTQKLTGLNHLFQHCKTCTIQEYGQLEETFSPEALQIMGDWLDKNVK
jgi:hypothetical protein